MSSTCNSIYYAQQQSIGPLTNASRRDICKYSTTVGTDYNGTGPAFSVTAVHDNPIYQRFSSTLSLVKIVICMN